MNQAGSPIRSNATRIRPIMLATAGHDASRPTNAVRYQCR